VSTSAPTAVLIRRVAEVTCVVVGLVVLAGWAFDLPPLRAFLPGVTNPMVATTALCFVLSGAALWLLSRAPRTSSRWLGRACAAVPETIGLLVLGQYAFGWETGLDGFLYRESARPLTGEMALPTAISFVLTGLALMLWGSETRRGRHPSQVLALLAGIVSLLSLVGRIYGVPGLSAFAGTVLMALHTALTFLVLCVGILAIRPDVGLMRVITSSGSGGWLIRRLLPTAAGGLVLAGWLRVAGQRAGLYGTEFGAAMTIASSIALLSVLIWFSANSLDRSDRTRRETETRLRESEERQRSILASIGDGVVTTDREGVIRSANPAMAGLSGWPEDEMLGKPHSEVFQFIDARGRPVPMEERFLPRAVHSQAVVVSHGFDVVLLARDGRRVPVQVTAAPILDARGELRGAVEVVRDVAHEQEVDQLKSSLISTVSHELRTPLTMIAGFSELLLSRDLGPERAREAAGRIHSSAQRLDRLIEDLLSVSRIDSGRVEARPEPLRTADVVAEAVEPFRREREILFDPPPDAPSVLGDREMVFRILDNLLSNAIKYSRDAVRVDVRANGSNVQISVTDAGIGMSPEERAQLFSQFFRANRPEVRDMRGTGLGLYITKNLVELQGGSISIDTELGRGTTVGFTLPLALPPEAEDDPASEGTRDEEAADRGR
jgi:PAS domain S-box-containing protein